MSGVGIEKTGRAGMKPAYWVVIAIVVAVFAYLLARPFFNQPKADAAKAATAPIAAPLVEVTLSPEVQRPYLVAFRGRTQAARTVSVRSETAGVVAAAPILQGTSVSAGTVLCRLAVDARQASLDQAKANLQAKQLQMQASSNLAAKGFRSKTQVLADQASLDEASAAVRQSEVALGQINIAAPFAGVFDHRDAEVGAYLAPGQPCGTMIELNPLLVVGDVPETEVGEIKVGAAATATLVSGGTINGRVRFVAHDADPATRTFRVEVTAANPGNKEASGLSGDVKIAAGVGPAHKVPVSALVLDAAGRQGVRYVDLNNRVLFSPVTVLEEAPDGLWISGLAGDARIITVGQSYVSEGHTVRVALAPAPGAKP
jgi:membrane fusion protein, multidrug efflux system